MRFETLKHHLEKQWPGIPLHLYQDKGTTGLLCSAEDNFLIDDWPVADYYESSYYDPKEKYHINGVHRKFIEFIEKRGFYFEWNNPGCISIYEH